MASSSPVQPVESPSQTPSVSASASSGIASPASASTSASTSTAQQEEPTDYKVFAPSNNPGRPLPPLSDDYFTPTALELKAAQATLAARTNNLVNAPLQLRSKREEAERAKRERWPQTTVRIRFTDRTQLEKVFPSTNKIRSVYAFVRACLRDDIKPIKFILYQSPPRRDLKVSDPKVRDLTLAELQLAPASVLLLRFEDESLNKTDYPAPLLPSVLSKMEELPAPKTEDKSPTPPAAEEKTPKKSQLTSDSNKPGELKVPKWLKLGKK
ncbi:hypothetical protein CC1G_10924 [Coprinopsis cinerea okayama7|uniref:UBX domain-containing protein n=1 Tax=Coprinopsis cinerea (strain Okayama-7 / 130 / ATCC MYA-4618 / FGSC 9003) TaxID=240176 RepID=A8NT27_COPC7|nr:hypothetical protein CC1G_10924 [Coprinopsis cinerea okayama7\|eukprot:XP_001836143.1 hypothetical protein CC1G_10924 [Coprinopsis cinerea okayama7\